MMDMAAQGHAKTEIISSAESVDELEQLVVFTVDQEEYAVPISEIREVLDVLEITPVPDSPPFVLGITNLRGKVVPVLDLEKRLNLQRQSDKKNRHILVTDLDAGLIGIQVDRVKEVLKVPKRAIQPTPSMITSRISPEFLRGVVVVAGMSRTQMQPTPEQSGAEEVRTDSRVLLLLELGKIISPDELKNISQAGAESSQNNREEIAQ